MTTTIELELITGGDDADFATFSVPAGTSIPNIGDTIEPPGLRECTVIGRHMAYDSVGLAKVCLTVR